MRHLIKMYFRIKQSRSVGSFSLFNLSNFIGAQTHFFFHCIHKITQIKKKKKKKKERKKKGRNKTILTKK